ncbi:MAG: flagellar basal body P-ring formation chaperone FlgA [Parvularculaceae bacterium]
MMKFSGVIAATILAAGYEPIASEELVAARNVSAGEILTAADIMTPKGAEGLRRAAGLIGQEALHALYKGQPFSESDVHPQTIVERNALVKMEFVKGPLTITAEGRALDSGGMGERVRVMNVFSRRIVSTIVVGTNTVKATP